MSQPTWSWQGWSSDSLGFAFWVSRQLDGGLKVFHGQVARVTLCLTHSLAHSPTASLTRCLTYLLARITLVSSLAATVLIALEGLSFLRSLLLR